MLGFRIKINLKFWCRTKHTALSNSLERKWEEKQTNQLSLLIPSTGNSFQYKKPHTFSFNTCGILSNHRLHPVVVVGILKQVIGKCTPGSNVRELCEFGDKLLLEETAKVFKKEKDMKKGKPWEIAVGTIILSCSYFYQVPAKDLMPGSLDPSLTARQLQDCAGQL